MTIEENVPLGKLTTVGIGGPARHFARPQSIAELEEALAWAAGEGLEVVTIGLGSNLLVADEGVDALALRLEGELAAAATEDGLLVAGGGATNAVCLHRTRAAGLGGFEFACAIPGTVGGGVQMNAGAYGSDWARDPRACARRLGRRLWLADPRRARAGVPALGASAGRGGRASRVQARAEALGSRSRRRSPSCRPGRKAAQPTNKRTFGSVFKNPEHELSAGRMLEACGLRGHRIRGAQISPRHANFIENAGERQGDRCAGADGRGAAAGARGVRSRARARGAARSAASSSRRPARRCRASGPRAETGLSACGPQAHVAHRRPPAPERAGDVCRSRWRGSCRRAGRSSSASRSIGLVVGGYAAARGTSMFAVRRDRGHRRASIGRRASRSRACANRRDEPRCRSMRRRSTGALRALPDVSLVSYDRAFPHTAKIVVSAERPVAVLRKGAQAWLVTERGRVLEQLDDPSGWSLPRIWIADAAVPGERRSAGRRGGARAGSSARASPLGRRAVLRARGRGSRARRRVRPRAAGRDRGPARSRGRPSAPAGGGGPCARPRRARGRVRGRQRARASGRASNSQV